MTAGLNGTYEKCVVCANQADIEKQTDIDRIYVGNEFCERLIPSVDEFAGMVNSARKSNKSITFLTPYCTEKGIEKINTLLCNSQIEREHIELVINDLGLMNRVATQYPEISLVLGRLFSTTLCHPLSGFREEKNSASKKKTQENFKLSDEYFSIFKNNNISRVEIDNVNSVYLYGDQFHSHNINVTLYVPYVFIANTRRCLFASQGKSSTKYSMLGCSQECTYEEAVIQNKFNYNIFVRNNSFFIHHDQSVRVSYELIQNIIDRIVTFDTIGVVHD